MICRLINKKGTDMDVRVCDGCGSLFNYLVGDVLCPECKKKQEKIFQKVKDYIDEHKGATMKQISEECEVAMSQIKSWIREERLHAMDEKDAYFSCKTCGRAIASGDYCVLCKRQLLGELGEAFGMNKTQSRVARKKNTPRMRFIRQ